MTTTNPYCDALGIAVPSLAQAAGAADANVYSLLIAALLEPGGPMTLEEAAARFEAAGIAPAPRALDALRRCRPARPPVYREADRYALDPHDDETDLWAFRLGLRPPKARVLALVRPDPLPLPPPDTPLSVPELDKGWRDGVPSDWSAQRIAVCVLDAHGGPMPPEDVVAFVRARTRWSLLKADSARYWLCGFPWHPHILHHDTRSTVGHPTGGPRLGPGSHGPPRAHAREARNDRRQTALG